MKIYIKLNFLFSLFILSLFLLLIFSQPVQASLEQQTVGILKDNQYPSSDHNLRLWSIKIMLEEQEKFPVSEVTTEEIQNSAPVILRNKYPLIIIPDGAIGFTPDVVQKLSEYVTKYAGSLFINEQAGWASPNSGNNYFWTNPPAFQKLAGVDYLRTDLEEGESPASYSYYGSGKMYIASKMLPVVNIFDNIDYESNSKNLTWLNYLFLKIKVIDPSVKVLAVAIDSNNPKNTGKPVLTLKNYMNGGKVLYSAYPLGLLRLVENDIPRRLMKSFIHYAAPQIPQIAYTQSGKSGLLFELHVDDRENVNILGNFQSIFLESKIPATYLITAGPDLYWIDDPLNPEHIADGLGVNALLNSSKILAIPQNGQKYGVDQEVGSHGGWAHETWSLNFDYLTNPQKEWLLSENIKVLRQILNPVSVSTNAAPYGRGDYFVWSLYEKYGIESTSDAYSHQGTPHLPIVKDPTDLSWKLASYYQFPYTWIYEYDTVETMIKKGNYTNDKIIKVYSEAIDAIVRQKEIRMIYGHPTGLYSNPLIIESIISKLAYLKHDKLEIKTMSKWTDWLKKRSQIRILGDFERETLTLNLEVFYPLDIKNFTIALGDYPRINNVLVRNLPKTFYRYDPVTKNIYFNINN
ncbi:MAG: hypothetical protein HY776_04855 [Actinobacteria bacterium]|nr:hypothetical protein [Actinomycetota bacterium]